MLYRDLYALINLEGHHSEKINLHRGVSQGCPLSPLLFTLALEPFVTRIHHNNNVKGFHVGKEKTKVALYADDVVLFMENPLTSIIEFGSTKKLFGTVSGYRDKQG